ncbi:hypothetical protein J6590_039728, partial [Homalodisca vitripennis]
FEVALYRRCALTQGRDVHSYETRGRDNYRTQEHRGVVLNDSLHKLVLKDRTGPICGAEIEIRKDKASGTSEGQENTKKDFCHDTHLQIRNKSISERTDDINARVDVESMQFGVVNLYEQPNNHAVKAEISVVGNPYNTVGYIGCNEVSILFGNGNFRSAVTQLIQEYQRCRRQVALKHVTESKPQFCEEIFKLPDIKRNFPLASQHQWRNPGFELQLKAAPPPPPPLGALQGLDICKPGRVLTDSAVLSNGQRKVADRFLRQKPLTTLQIPALRTRSG